VAHVETQIMGDGTRRSDGLLDCTYSKSWPLRYSVTYQVNIAGGSCRLAVFEDSILKESSWPTPAWWHFVGQVHFYDGTCWSWPP
jgi:hypothetical protein